MGLKQACGKFVVDKIPWDWLCWSCYNHVCSTGNGEIMSHRRVKRYVRLNIFQSLNVCKDGIFQRISYRIIFLWYSIWSLHDTISKMVQQKRCLSKGQVSSISLWYDWFLGAKKAIRDFINLPYQAYLRSRCRLNSVVNSRVLENVCHLDLP